MTEPKKTGANALALLTASYDGLMGTVLAGVLNEGPESQWYQPDAEEQDAAVQRIQSHLAELTAKVERLTLLLSDMTYLTRMLVQNLAKEKDATEADILDALGRALN